MTCNKHYSYDFMDIESWCVKVLDPYAKDTEDL